MFRWLLSLCLTLGAVEQVDSAAVPVTPSEADRPFIELYEGEWQWRLREYPQLATAVGVHDYDDRLGSFDLRSQRARLRQLVKFRKELGQLDVAGLSPPQRINHAVFAAQLDNAIAALELDAHLMPMTSDSSFYADLAMLPDVHPRNNERDYRNYLARLRAVPRYLDEHTDLLRQGLARGMTLPAVVLQGREAPIRAVAEATDIESLAFYTPFQSMPSTIPETRANELRAEARELIRNKLVPAYARLLRYFVSTYQPGARRTIAAYDLPGGAAYYRQQIREYTTLDLDPEAIHQIGLGEVARIRAEMDQVIHDAGFEGDFAAFLHFLRNDPQFYARTPRELLMHASYWAKRIDGLLPKYFSQLPRQTYGVAPVPAAIAPYYTTGRYNPAPEGGHGAGFYWVNTWKLEARPLYALAALTLHEAVPGHHLQTALASEQAAQPAFRRYSYISAFGEGWALYAEHLGVEMGVYETPYDQFGRLTYEMWRAARLVVDTGMHAKGWTREEALSLLRENTALSEHEIATEVDRYISWPGQALSYKLGELKIRSLRQLAETRLGNRFDLRRFHDAVLALGSVPLPVLEAQIARHIESELAVAARP
jgi:uncharacterized protein (DUF885 family)